MSQTSLRLRVVPRYPASVTATDGIKAVRSGVDLVVKSDYGNLVQVADVPNPDKTFMLAWDSDIDNYQSMSFSNIINNIQDAVIGPTLAAIDTTTPGTDQAIYFTEEGEATTYTISDYVRGISNATDQPSYATAIGAIALGNSLFKIDTFAGAPTALIPVAEDVVRIQDRQANFAAIDSEPFHDLKFENDGRWFEIDEDDIDVRMAGAGQGGDDAAAFSIAAKAVPAFDNVPAPYNAIPHPLQARVKIPAGTYTLTSLVDVGGRDVIWIADKAANITGTDYLNGMLIRDNTRITKGYPIGTLDQAVGSSVSIGGNYGDKSPAVTGVTSTQQVADYSQRDAVAVFGAAYAAPAIVDVNTATYTATTATIAALTSDQVKRLRPGMVIYTYHATRCAGILQSWNSDGSVLTVVEWRAKGGSSAVTPADGTGLSIAFDKIWGANFVANLSSDGYASQSIGVENSMRNQRGAGSISLDDPTNRVWGFLAATVTAGTAGYYQCQSGFMTRGDFYYGFTSQEQQIGFNYRSATAKTGYQYYATGDAISVYNATNGYRSIRATYAGDIYLGQQEAATGVGRLLTFFTSGLNTSYDARIQATGGSAAAGNGTLTYSAIDNAFGGNIRPTADNVRSCGTASFRWSQFYAANGTINTSDTTLKSEFKSISDAEREALLACRQHIGLFQWLDAVAEKGAAVARIHAGVPAQTCIAEFTSRGLDPWRYGWFCRDRKIVSVKTIKTVQEPAMEAVEINDMETYIDGDVARRRSITRIEMQPKVKIVPVVDDNGVQLKDIGEDGVAVPVVQHVQVMEDREIEIEELQETDDYVYSIRYTELTMAILAAASLN